MLKIALHILYLLCTFSNIFQTANILMVTGSHHNVSEILKCLVSRTQYIHKSFL